MKVAALLSLIGSAAAFAPAAQKVRISKIVSIELYLRRFADKQTIAITIRLATVVLCPDHRSCDTSHVVNRLSHTIANHMLTMSSCLIIFD